MKGKSLIYAVIAGIAGVAGLVAAANAAPVDVFPQDNIVAIAHASDAQYAPIAAEHLVEPASLHLVAAEYAAPHVAAEPIALAFEVLVYEFSPSLPLVASQVALDFRSRAERVRYRNSLSAAVGAVEI